jgi:hypothetical protein
MPKLAGLAMLLFGCFLVGYVPLRAISLGHFVYRGAVIYRRKRPLHFWLRNIFALVVATVFVVVGVWTFIWGHKV